ncbi:uncharacterized protein LOC133713701 [Rosa rugosa]|uniref:uncharacterized protein LOC133713701 n=1 Tax=Rosa rugosa TaxID=74645 RepID=UPI002B40C92D|nr:uncharacterized protein LOC133713701 [Rosa rugosa]
MPANRRGSQKEKMVSPAETVTVAVSEPQRGSRPATAGSTRVVLQRKRRQNDSGGEEDDAETIGARQQKRVKQASPKVAVVTDGEVQASDLDSFVAYAEFLTDQEREFLFHLCERLGFGGLEGIVRSTAVDQSPFSSAFGHLSVGLHEMFLATSKQPRVERELRGQMTDLQRELGEAQDKLAEVQQRLTKAECDKADARGQLNVAIARDIERNNRVAELDQNIALLKDQLAAKVKKIEILLRDSASKSAEVKRLADEVAQRETKRSQVEAAAVKAFKQSAEYKKAMTEAAKAGAVANVELLNQKGAIDWVKASQPTGPSGQNSPPAKGVVPVQAEGASSGSGESGVRPVDDSQRTPPPTQFEVSRTGFLAAHTRTDGTIITPSPTARGSDQTSRLAEQQPPPEDEEVAAAPENP